MTLEQIRPGVWRCVLASMPDRLLAAAACATIHASRPWWLRIAWWTSRAWVTVGKRIYLPAGFGSPWSQVSTLEHELTHVAQWMDWGLLLWLGYLGWPLPIGLAWTRYAIEREAYGVEVRRHGAAPERCADALCSSLYGWPWPRRLALAYFERIAQSRRA